MIRFDHNSTLCNVSKEKKYLFPLTLPTPHPLPVSLRTKVRKREKREEKERKEPGDEVESKELLLTFPL